MKYFIKYLPVEGEIKEGENTNKGIIREIFRKNIHTGEDVYETELFQRYFLKDLKKIKLFLCSRDIQVGDEIIYDAELTTKYKSTTWDTVGAGGGNSFKVIGEISPDALWVKEGDKFDEFCEVGEYKNDYKPYIQLKGPCGYFH